MQERRKNVRIPCRLEIKASSGKKWFLINSKNIGRDGMMLSTELDIQKLKKLGIDNEAKVFLSFYLPGNSALIKASGKIVHIQKEEDSINKKGISIIGIQFENLPEYFKKQLGGFVLVREKS